MCGCVWLRVRVRVCVCVHREPECREIVENEQLAMAQLLTHTYGHNPKNTEPAPLGRFAKCVWLL